MRFLESMTVARSNKSIDSFSQDWDESQARTALSGLGHHFVEYLTSGIRGCEPGKVYLDRDVYVGDEAPEQSIIDAESEVVREKILEMMRRLTTENVHLTAVIATRHGYCAIHKQFKLSFRPFLQGMRIRYTDIPVVIKWVAQEDFWDMSVYKAREQLLAAINGCKGKISGHDDKRVLSPEAGKDHSLLMYTAQHVDPSWPMLDIPDRLREPAPSSALPPISINPTSRQSSFICGLIRCLRAETSDDRKTWIAIGVSLKSEGGGDRYFEEWVRFSRKSSKFEGRDECIKVWSGLRSERHPVSGRTCGLGTLIFLAKRDDSRRFAAVVMAQGNNKSPASTAPGTRVGRGRKHVS